MDTVLEGDTNGVLNETTNTVHKHKPGASEFDTECGITRHVTPDHLRRIAIESAIAGTDTQKCGRCFPGAGGY